MQRRSVSGRRKRNKLLEFECAVGADVRSAEERNGIMLNKNGIPQNSRIFNNPASALLAAMMSIIFWCIFWLAKALIVIAGIILIISFLFPHKIFGLLNRLMDKQDVERKFRDEL